MKHFSVFVWILAIAEVHFGRGSLSNSCQEICCSTPTDRAIFGLFEEGKNDTSHCQECLRNQSSDANVTQEQLCFKPTIKTTKTKKNTKTSLCQEMFDNASNDFVGIVTGVKVHFHRIENSWYINVTWNAFSDPNKFKNWSHYAIQWISSQGDKTKADCGLVSKNQTFFIINETEDGWKYPRTIYLNVSTYPLKKTGYRFEIEGRPIPEMVSTPATLPSKVSPGVVGAIIVGSCAGIILIALVIVVWKLRYPGAWRGFCGNRIRSLSENRGNFEYDASILYSSLDEKWVTDQLIPLLESENDFKCFIHFRDYEAGKVIHENMADSVYNCRKNLAVVSKNFLKSRYCQTELHMALERVNRCGDCSLIVINLDGVSIDKLPKGLRIRTFVNLTSSQEQKTWRKRLVKQISVEEDKRSKMDADAVASNEPQLFNHINEACSSSTENV